MALHPATDVKLFVLRKGQTMLNYSMSLYKCIREYKKEYFNKFKLTMLGGLES